MKNGASMALVLLVASACTSAPPPPQQRSWDNLVLLQSSTLDRVYVHPQATFDQYRRVMLDRVEVSFDKNWDPKKGAVALQGMQPDEIRADVARSLREVFKEQLAAKGYPVVDSSDEDVLRVRAAITDLFIRAAENTQSGGSAAYAMDATHMTLVAELFDSETGLLLARAYDTARGAEVGTLQVAHSLTSSAEGRRALKKWAGALGDALERAKANKAGDGLQRQ